MITITASLSAERLVANPRAPLELAFSVSDSNVYYNKADIIVSWGDGSGTVLNFQALPYGPQTIQHGYAPGVYLVKITVTNYRSPDPDTAVFSQEIEVVSSQPAPVAEAPVVQGPILPREQGYPSPAVWNYNMATDGIILESSLRMLMLTRKGERVMDPAYGTNLWSLVFNQNTDELSSAVSAEISQAVAANEPRVEFLSSQTERSGKTVSVKAAFSNRLSRQRFVLSVGFAQ